MQVHVKKSQIAIQTNRQRRKQRKPIYAHPVLRKEKNTALGCVI